MHISPLFYCRHLYISLQRYSPNNYPEQYGITLGKAQLIQEILGKNSLHTFDELAPLSINELNILLGKEGAETHVEVVGTASEKGYIGETKAKEIALAKAEIGRAHV